MGSERLKIWLGFAERMTLIVVLPIMALVFGIGKIEEKTSFGLQPTLQLLGVVVGYIFGSMRLGQSQDKEK